jgi:hypothetical protein
MTDDQPRSRLRYMTLAEACEDDWEPDPPIGSGWGPWALNDQTMTLETDRPQYPAGGGYWIDLESCTSSAEVLDWVCQVAGKLWADDVTLAGLVRALNDVLNPQGTICSSGQGRRLSKARIRRQVMEIAKRSRATRW